MGRCLVEKNKKGQWNAGPGGGHGMLAFWGSGPTYNFSNKNAYFVYNHHTSLAFQNNLFTIYCDYSDLTQNDPFSLLVLH